MSGDIAEINTADKLLIDVINGRQVAIVLNLLYYALVLRFGRLLKVLSQYVETLCASGFLIVISLLDKKLHHRFFA
jgi:hypothetical protein